MGETKKGGIYKKKGGHKLVFTGHSMGGALAQLAAACFSDYCPHLVTFGAPAVGNVKFVKHLEQRVQVSDISLWKELAISLYMWFGSDWSLGSLLCSTGLALSSMLYHTNNALVL